MSTLLIGDTAPAINLPRDGGEMVNLAAMMGQKVVIYFYPKDDTPGCTKEAIGFTEAAAEFVAAGAVVWGVSKDSVAKHENFRTKYELGIPLVSDEDGSVCEDYGVWIEKNIHGKKYMGIERATYLIDGTGKIVQFWRKVKVSGHVEAVLKAVRGV